MAFLRRPRTLLILSLGVECIRGNVPRHAVDFETEIIISRFLPISIVRDEPRINYQQTVSKDSDWETTSTQFRVPQGMRAGTCNPGESNNKKQQQGLELLFFY